MSSFLYHAAEATPHKRRIVPPPGEEVPARKRGEERVGSGEMNQMGCMSR